MNQEPGSNKRIFRLTLVVLVVILVLGIGYLLITILNSRSTASLSEPFVQNLNNPYKMDNEQLYFYTGSNFATLNTTTNQTKQLGPNRLLPKNLSDVQWTKNGVAVQAANYTLFDDLGSLVPTQTVPGSKPTYAWYVPYTGKPEILDKNTSSLYADSNTGMIYYLWKINPAADGALLRTYSSSDGRRQQFMAEGISNPFRIVYTAGDYVWALAGYGKEVSLVKYSRTEPSQTLATNVFNSDNATVNGPFVMINESFFVAVQQKDKKAALFSYDLNKPSRKVLDNDFTGSINRGSGTSVYATSTKNNKAVVYKITGAKESQTISATMPKGTLTHGFDWGSDQLVVNLLKQGQVLGPRKATQNLPAVKSTGLEKTINQAHQGSLYSVSIDLDNAATSNSYNVTVYPPYEQNTSIFMEDVKAAGYDPNQLNLTFTQTVIRQTTQ